MKKIFYKSPSINYVLKIFALIKFIQNSNYKKLIIKDVPKVCDSSIKQINKVFEIKITIYYEKDISYKFNIKTFIPRILQSFYTLTKYYLKSFKFKNNVIKKSNNNKNKFKNFLIVNYLLNYDSHLLNNGIYYSDYWGDLPVILKNKGYIINWLHVFGDSSKNLDQFIKQTNLISNNSNNNEHHFFLENQFNIKIYLQVIFKYFKIILENYNLYFESKN